jgi:two-component system CheB/CheR fusion protein
VVQGKHFFNLDIGLPVEQLKQPIRACMTDERGASQVTLQATNRRGKTIQCAVTCSPLSDVRKQVSGAVVLMEDKGEVKSA